MLVFPTEHPFSSCKKLREGTDRSWTRTIPEIESTLSCKWKKILTELNYCMWTVYLMKKFKKFFWNIPVEHRSTRTMYIWFWYGIYFIYSVRHIHFVHLRGTFVIACLVQKFLSHRFFFFLLLLCLASCDSFLCWWLFLYLSSTTILFVANVCDFGHILSGVKAHCF